MLYLKYFHLFIYSPHYSTTMVCISVCEQNQLDLDMKHMKALMDGDLTSPSGIYECTVAAQALHKCMNAEIHPCKYCTLKPSY